MRCGTYRDVAEEKSGVWCVTIALAFCLNAPSADSARHRSSQTATVGALDIGRLAWRRGEISCRTSSLLCVTEQTNDPERRSSKVPTHSTWKGSAKYRFTTTLAGITSAQALTQHVAGGKWFAAVRRNVNAARENHRQGHGVTHQGVTLPCTGGELRRLRFNDD